MNYKKVILSSILNKYVMFHTESYPFFPFQPDIFIYHTFHLHTKGWRGKESEKSTVNCI